MVSRTLVLVSAAILAGFAGYLFFLRPSGHMATRAPVSEPPDDDSYRDPDDHHEALDDPHEAPSHRAEPAVPKMDRARADEMRAKILALLTEAGPGRVAMASAPRAGGDPGTFREMPAGGSGNQADGAQGKYIQSVVRDDFVPLARQCYGAAQAVNPDLQGTFELHFRIVGDKRVGGVVDEAFVGDGGTLHDPDFEECMTKSMMSVSFDAPPNDGEVTVTYPITFGPDEADAPP